MAELILTLKNNNTAEIKLKNDSKTLSKEDLTQSQDFDIMLITSIDRLLTKNRIDRLSLKSFKILGKMRPEAISSMITRTIKTALEI